MLLSCLLVLLTAFSFMTANVRGSELSPVEVLGPDGIVYPNWEKVGVENGIPEVKVQAKLADFDGLPDDGNDDADALEKGMESVGAEGGGVLLLQAGTYELNRPVVCVNDDVVLRGAGKDKTKIRFTYAPPEKGVTFFKPAPNSTVHKNTWVEIHADPNELKSLAIYLGDQEVASRNKHRHWGGTFSINCSGSAILRTGKSGNQTLRAVATFDNGDTSEATLPVVLATGEQKDSNLLRIPRYLGAITFAGERPSSKKILLKKDAKRGDTQLTLSNAKNLKPGDIIVILAPKTERWDRKVQNACEWGTYRRNEYRIIAVDGNKISIHQPLRIPFPAIDRSYVQRYQPIQQCGVEKLSLEQTKKLWTGGIIFSHAWNCWARDVHVQKAGRWPIYPSPAKHCEVRDCTIDDAWYHGGGGTAYVGFEMAYDCLMDNVTTNRLRHAPCVQWSAAGNVIHNSTFIQSDGQWHSGWTHENLFENCVIDAKQGTGSYGHGFWASPPEDKAHGPNGPRNVVWGCNVVCPKSGVWMGGMNTGWLILYNKIVCGTGPAVFMKTNSDEHIISGNVFVIKNNNANPFSIWTVDCDGVQITNNKILGGNSRTVTGKSDPAIFEGNQHTVEIPENLPDRPEPPVESIYQWQLDEK